jgi:pimeloyl-ACP methyl ester carboxylesterase
VAANTMQASPAGEALLAVESSAMFVLIGSMPHTAWLAGQIPPDGKGFELQKYVRNRPRGRLRYRCSYSPPGELVDVGGTELHTLLINADTEGPYVLVGHPYDGLYTQMYAARYSDEVAGVALVDSSHPEQFTRSPEGRAMHKRTRSPRRIQDPSPRLGCVRCESALLAVPSLCMMFP